MMTETGKTNDLTAAATVILVREESEEIQVYLLKRSSESGFFPGSYVFPGGVLDAEDRHDGLWASSIDVPLEEISTRLAGSLGIKDALAYGVAAIRETFEEAGVLLAERNGRSPEDLERVCGSRLENGLPEGWLREGVVSGGWVLSLSRLCPWSHWITPEAFPRRFDTRFFLAFLPEGQECAPDERETVHGIWISPKRGLSANLAGEIPLSPPTLITLHELLAYRTTAGLKREAATRGWGEARLPRFIKLSRGAVIIEPWDPMYGKDLEIDPEALGDATLEVGEPFSRIWLHNGVWRPVGIP